MVLDILLYGLAVLAPAWQAFMAFKKKEKREKRILLALTLLILALGIVQTVRNYNNAAEFSAVQEANKKEILGSMKGAASQPVMRFFKYDDQEKKGYVTFANYGDDPAYELTGSFFWTSSDTSDQKVSYVSVGPLTVPADHKSRGRFSFDMPTNKDVLINSLFSTLYSTYTESLFIVYDGKNWHQAYKIIDIKHKTTTVFMDSSFPLEKSKWAVNIKGFPNERTTKALPTEEVK